MVRQRKSGLGYGWLLLLFAAAWVLLATQAWAAANFERIPAPNTMWPLYVADRVLITLQPGRTEADLAGLNAEYGSRVVRKLRMGNVYVLEIPGSGTPAETLMADRFSILQRYPAVADIQFNYAYYILDTPNDEFYLATRAPFFWDFIEGQWPLQPDPDDPTIEHIYAPQAWDIQKGSDQVIVAVLDTGVRERYKLDDSGALIRAPHPDLEDRLLIGFDVADWPEPDEFADPSPTEDENGPSMIHGTHVAGIIGAQADNLMGIAGLCWNGVWILPIKVFRDNEWWTTDDIVADGIYYCISYRSYYASDTAEPLKVNVINLSLGGQGRSRVLSSAVREAALKGIVVVAASGNSWSYGPYPPVYPSAYDEVISVGATEYADTVTIFSQRGHAVDITAPGDWVLSTAWHLDLVTAPVEPDGNGDGGDGGNGEPPFPGSVGPTQIEPEPLPTWPDPYGNYFVYASGTSTAAPHVAAAAALLLSHSVPPSDVKQILCETATPKGIGRPNDAYGWGVLNVQKALEKASIDVQIHSPGNGSVVTTARPRFRIDFRNPKPETVRVRIDGVLVVGPATEGPALSNWEQYYLTLDAAAGKTYLLFQYALDPALAVNGVHTITASAETAKDFDIPPSLPFAAEDSHSFRVRAQTLGQGWHLFSVPYHFDTPTTPEMAIDSTTAVLARWHYATGTYGRYAIYSLDGTRTDVEASFMPPSVEANVLAAPLGAGAATPPAGVGYWLYVPDTGGIPVPETTGRIVDDRPYVIGLYWGWNMVGDPFPSDIPWSSVVVEYAGRRVSIAEAMANGWISDFIFQYDSVYHRYTWRPASRATMVPWEAQWVRVNVRGPNGWPEPDIKLIVPPNAYTGPN